MKPNNKWNELTMQQKADLMRLYVANGYTNLDSIRKHYNAFNEGGPAETQSEEKSGWQKAKELIYDVFNIKEKQEKQEVQEIQKRPSKWENDYNDLTIGYKQTVDTLANKLNISEEGIEGYYNSGMLNPALSAKYKGVNARKRNNDSKTSNESTNLETKMNSAIYRKKDKTSPNMAYAIPYIEDLEIKVPGVGRTTKNALDSLAKYAALADIPLSEALGLAAQETALGAIPIYNYMNVSKGKTEEEKQKRKEFNRALGNSSYFRNYGVIPAENLVRDFRYNIIEDPIDRNIPPLLHAFEYWKEGNYNRGDPNHTNDVRRKGNEVINTDAIKQWIENSEFAKKALKNEKKSK